MGRRGVLCRTGLPHKTLPSGPVQRASESDESGTRPLSYPRRSLRSLRLRASDRRVGRRLGSAEPDPDNPWPDARCGECHAHYLREGEWNEANEAHLNVKLVCHECYQRFKATCSVHYI